MTEESSGKAYDKVLDGILRQMATKTHVGPHEFATTGIAAEPEAFDPQVPGLERRGPRERLAEAEEKIGALEDRVADLERRVPGLAGPTVFQAGAPAVSWEGRRAHNSQGPVDGLPAFSHASCDPCGHQWGVLEGKVQPGDPCPLCGRATRGFDSYREGQDLPSVNARVKNSVTMNSSVRTDEGSDALGLVNQVSHTVAEMYKMIGKMQGLDEAHRDQLVEFARKLEGLPARFISGRKGARG